MERYSDNNFVYIFDMANLSVTIKAKNGSDKVTKHVGDRYWSSGMIFTKEDFMNLYNSLKDED